jgi:hypothetical protein
LWISERICEPAPTHLSHSFFKLVLQLKTTETQINFDAASDRFSVAKSSFTTPKSGFASRKSSFVTPKSSLEFVNQVLLLQNQVYNSCFNITIRQLTL